MIPQTNAAVVARAALHGMPFSVPLPVLTWKWDSTTLYHIFPEKWETVGASETTIGRTRRVHGHASLRIVKWKGGVEIARNPEKPLQRRLFALY